MGNTRNIYIAVPTGNGDASIQSVITLVVTDHGANLRFAMAFNLIFLKFKMGKKGYIM
jgi:hypothetical protein